MQAPRQHPVPQGQHHLDHTGDAGGGLGVADVRFDRTEVHRPVGGPVLPVGGEHRLGLDRVSQHRPGPVRLHRVHLGGVEAGVGQCLPDDPLLGRAVGRGQAVGGAVGVHGGASDDGEDRVPVPPGVGEPLDEQHSGALAPPGAVRRLGERLAAAVGGETALAGEAGETGGGGHDEHPADQGERALALPQCPRRQVQGDQRRGAGGVDGERGPLKPERVGDASGDHTRRGAGEDVALVAAAACCSSPA